MLGLILLYWIGKYYYKLAEEYEKSKWGYAVIGVISYYAGAFIAGFVIAIVAPTFINSVSDVQLGLIALPFGLAITCGFYFLLKNNFKKNHKNPLDELEDIGKEEE